MFWADVTSRMPSYTIYPSLPPLFNAKFNEYRKIRKEGGSGGEEETDNLMPSMVV